MRRRFYVRFKNSSFDRDPGSVETDYYRDGEHELYHLGTGPLETENLIAAPRYEDPVEELLGKTLDWQVRTRDRAHFT